MNTGAEQETFLVGLHAGQFFTASKTTFKSVVSFRKNQFFVKWNKRTSKNVIQCNQKDIFVCITNLPSQYRISLTLIYKKINSKYCSTLFSAFWSSAKHKTSNACCWGGRGRGVLHSWVLAWNSCCMVAMGRVAGFLISSTLFSITGQYSERSISTSMFSYVSTKFFFCLFQS